VKTPELITETVKEAAANVQQQMPETPVQTLGASRLLTMLEPVFAVSPYAMQTAQRWW